MEATEPWSISSRQASRSSTSNVWWIAHQLLGLKEPSGDKDNNNGIKKIIVKMRQPLRHITPLPGEHSRIVYLTGIDKQTSQKN
jgi:hypothetical protein